jgi:5-methyltetrahydropteroyltriglutamate--homocysteine methyltransferase
MVQSSVLGFPRMGANRELKKANEAYWADKLSRDELLKEAKRLRLEHWKIQKDAGVDVIPSNDFAFYDHLLDHIQMFNVSTTCSSTARPTPLTRTGHPRAILEALAAPAR